MPLHGNTHSFECYPEQICQHKVSQSLGVVNALELRDIRHESYAYRLKINLDISFALGVRAEVERVRVGWWVWRRSRCAASVQV